MGLKINEDGMWVDPKNPNIFIGPAFIEKDTSLIQRIPADTEYLKEDIGIKVDKIVQ